MRLVAVMFVACWWPLLSVAGASQTKEAKDRPELKFRKLDSEPQTYFELSQVLDMRRAIVASDATESEKIQQIEEAYNNAQHLLATAADFTILLTSCKDKEVRMANDAFFQKNLDTFFAQVSTCDQVVVLDKAVATVKTALEIKRRGLKYAQSGSDFIKLVQPNLYDDSSHAKPFHQKALFTFIAEHVDDFKNLNPTIAEVRELKRYVLTLETESKKLNSIVADINDAFFDSFSGNEQLALLVDENKVSSAPLDVTKLKLDGCSINTKEYKHVKPMLMHLLVLIKNPIDYVSLVKTHLKALSDQQDAVLGFIRNTLPVFSDMKPSISCVMSIHNLVNRSKTGEERKVATLLKIKEQFLPSFAGADLIRLMDFGVEEPSKIYRRQLSALKKLHAINF